MFHFCPPWVEHVQRSLAPLYGRGNQGLAKGSELAKSPQLVNLCCWGINPDLPDSKPYNHCAVSWGHDIWLWGQGQCEEYLLRAEWKWTRISENRCLLLPRHSVLSHHSHPNPIPHTQDAKKTITFLLWYSGTLWGTSLIRRVTEFLPLCFKHLMPFNLLHNSARWLLSTLFCRWGEWSKGRGDITT